MGLRHQPLYHGAGSDFRAAPSEHTSHSRSSGRPHTPAFRLNALMLASSCALAGVGGALAFTPQAVQATEPAATAARNYAIAAGRLSDVLAQFAAASGVALSFDPQALQGQPSSGLQGRYTVQQGFAHLLQSTPWQVQAQGSNAYTLRPVSTVPAANVGRADTLPEVVVTASPDSSGTTEGTGSYTTRSTNTATGLNLSPRETPQSVSVVTQQLIKDRHYVSLDQALRDTPGVAVTQDTGDARWEYYARGSVIDTIQYDGLAFPIQAFTRDVAPDDDLVIYDRIEVVRGATGLLTGAGNPSASVNLIRKHGTPERQTSLSTTVSSWGNIRSTLDGSGPLNDEGTLRGRAVISGFTGKNQRKSSESNNGLLYAVLDMDLSNATTASLGLSYQQQNNDRYSWTGLPTRRDGSFYDFDHDTFLGSDWFYLDRRQSTLYADIDHRFGNGWTLKAAARGGKASSDYVSGSGYLITPNYYREDYDVDYKNNNHSLSINASGPFSAMGRTHELIVGASTGRDHIWTQGGFVPDTFVGDPENYDYRSIPRPDLTQNAYTRGFTVQQYGIFAATRLSLSDALKLLLGSRVSWYENNSYTDNAWGLSRGSYKATAELAPYVGLVYDLNESYNVYASYTEIFNPQISVDHEGKLLDPVKGSNVEFGIKGSLAGERLNFSAAVFETKRTNLAQSLPNTSCNPGVLSCAEAAREVRTRGVDLEVTGEIQPGWNIQAGYTYSPSKYIAGVNKGQPFGTDRSPKHLVKLGMTYQLRGDWQGMTIGMSIRAQDKTYYKGSDFYIEQPTFSLVDVMARYTLNDQLALQLNINNLFDRSYYQAITSTYHSGNFMGAGRNVLLTLDYRW